MQIAILMAGALLGAYLFARAERLCSGPETLPRSDEGTSVPRISPASRFYAAAVPHRAKAAGFAPDVLWGLAGVACALISLTLEDAPLPALLGTLYLLTLGALFTCDLACYRLPNVLTATLLALGGMLGWLHHGPVATLAAAVTGAGLFWAVSAVYARLRGHHGLGGGDVKMMAGLSAAAGPFGIAWIVLVASGASLLAEVIRAGGVKTLSRSRRVPFGCGLALAGAILWAVQAAAL